MIAIVVILVALSICSGCAGMVDNADMSASSIVDSILKEVGTKIITGGL